MSATGSNMAVASIMNKETGAVIRCKFNPKEYTFTKQNTWTAAKGKGANMPPLEFGSGQPAQLTMQLFFDTYEDGNDAEDVREKYTDAIWELMMVVDHRKNPTTKKARPPMVRFQWGKAWSFDAVITNLKQTFTMFLADGTPVRATMDVTFQQIKDEKLYPPQNPTSGGVGGERVWRVTEGDTLASIAYQAYGDSTRWRPIADANQLESVRSLQPGTLLEIPNA